MDKKGGFQAKLGLNWFTFALFAVGFAVYNFYSEYSYTGYITQSGSASSGKPDLAVDRITATASRLSGEDYNYALKIDYTITILNRGNAASTQNFVVDFVAQIADAPNYGISNIPNFNRVEPVNTDTFTLNPRQKISKTFTQYLTSEQVPSTAKTLRVSTSALADQHVNEPLMNNLIDESNENNNRRGQVLSLKVPNQPAVSPASRPASVCAADVQQCNDGTYVSRDPANNCNFRACPVQILGPDFDNNGCVESVNDFQSFANAFKAKRLAVDYSGDGKIDMDDFFRFADRIGSSQNQQACSRLMTAALS